MNIFQRHVLQITAAALLPMLVACQASPSQAEKSLHAATFDEALRDCRMKQPGRINRRLSLRVDSPNIAACLRRNGWEVNGDVQTLVASL
jgi:hypothetical protein